MKYLFFVILSFIVAGCSTTPVSFSDSIDVPAERRSEGYSKYVVNDKNDANVIIVRDSGFTGSAVAVPIYVDGVRVAALHVAESLAIKLDPGEHLLGITQGGYFSEKAEKRNLDEQVISVADDKMYYYRVGILMSKGLILQRSSQLE